MSKRINSTSATYCCCKWVSQYAVLESSSCDLLNCTKVKITRNEVISIRLPFCTKNVYYHDNVQSEAYKSLLT